MAFAKNVTLRGDNGEFFFPIFFNDEWISYLDNSDNATLETAATENVGDILDIFNRYFPGGSSFSVFSGFLSAGSSQMNDYSLPLANSLNLVETSIQADGKLINANDSGMNYPEYRSSSNTTTLRKFTNPPSNSGFAYAIGLAGSTSGTNPIDIRITVPLFPQSFIQDSIFSVPDPAPTYRYSFVFHYAGKTDNTGNVTITVSRASSTAYNTVQAIFGGQILIDETDPYNRIVGSSTTGGGGGSGDFTGQTIGEPSLPQISALNSGFISAYAPSVANLNQLASYMWTSDFSDNLKKVFGDNPMNTILGLSCVPVQPPLGGGSTVILGNIDTGISMPTIGAQYTKVNCGSIPIEPKYGAFLDYEPYTSIDLFLPYIGMVQLSTNDVMGKSLGVVYTVDVLSGACVANVSCGGSIMYTFEGACATQFPVTNNDYSNVFKAAVDAASSIVGAVGGAVASGMTGNVAGAVTSIVDGAAGAATAAMNAHPTVNRSGSLSGSAGLMGIQHPFIVWTTPNMVASNRQNSFIGYPNFITTTLSGCAGYTEVENINLGIAGATSEEIAEIKTLLKNGVIF